MVIDKELMSNAMDRTYGKAKRREGCKIIHVLSNVMNPAKEIKCLRCSTL